MHILEPQYSNYNIHTQLWHAYDQISITNNINHDIARSRCVISIFFNVSQPKTNVLIRRHMTSKYFRTSKQHPGKWKSLHSSTHV